MSIDARVIGLNRERKEGSTIKLILEDRPGGGPAGQRSLLILNTEQVEDCGGWLLVLKRLIGKDVWGGSGQIMLGDRKLADRDVYTGIRLVENWRDVINAAHSEINGG